MLEQLRRNWCIFSHWSSGKVISIILLLFHNLIPKCQQNLERWFPSGLLTILVMHPNERHTLEAGYASESKVWITMRLTLFGSGKPTSIQAPPRASARAVSHCQLRQLSLRCWRSNSAFQPSPLLQLSDDVIPLIMVSG